MKHLLIASAVLLPAWSSAIAQENHDLRVRVGLGAQVRPEFIGADDSSLAPLFHVNIARGTHQFSFGAPDDSPSIALLSRNGFSFGPAGNIEGRRKNSNLGAPVGPVSRTFEAGAFVQYLAGNSFRLRGELLKGINGHEGTYWRDRRGQDLARQRPLRLFDRAARPVFGRAISAGLFRSHSGRIACDRTGAYRPGGGVHGVAVASGVTYALNNRWGLFGYARYERLVGDAAKSLIIRELGSRNQLSGGVGLNYTFTIPR